MKHFFSQLTSSVKGAVSRFFASFCLTVCLFGVIAVGIITEPTAYWEQILFRLGLAIAVSLLLCTVFALLLERKNTTTARWQWITVGASLLAGVAAYFLVKGFDTNRYVVMGYMGVMAALAFCLLFVCGMENKSKAFSHLIKNGFVYALVCGVLMGGVSLCLLAFQQLIYNFDNFYKSYAIWGMFLLVVVFVNLNLGALPKRGEQLEIPKLFKVVVLHVALPVYLLLLAILYVYLGKIAVTHTFPSGQVNWFASIAAALFVFFSFTLRQYTEESKLAHWFVKLGGGVMIPVIAMQCWGVQIRLSAYGFTEARLLSVVFIGVVLLFVALTFIHRGKYINLILPVAAVAALVVTLTPLNAIDVSVASQSARLTRLLTQNNMLSGDAILSNGQVEREDKQEITAAYEYLLRSEGKLPAFVEQTRDKEFEQVFGFDPTYQWRGSDGAEFGEFSNKLGAISVEGYRTITPLSWYSDKGNDQEPYPIQEKAVELYHLHGLQADNLAMEFDVPQGRIILSRMSFQVDAKGEISLSSYDGYLLQK